MDCRGEGREGRHGFFRFASRSRPTRCLAAFVLTFLAGSHAFGSDCPDGKTAKKGFVLGRPGVNSVVRPSDEQVTMLQNTYKSETPQTQFLVGGLIEVFRDGAKGQFVALPESDFRKLFPLREGEEQEVSWLWLDAKKGRVERNSMSLKVTGVETLSLGSCAYDVQAVRQILMSGEGEVLDARTALYSPELQAVLAKRYDEGTTRELTVAYRTIRPLVE